MGMLKRLQSHSSKRSQKEKHIKHRTCFYYFSIHEFRWSGWVHTFLNLTPRGWSLFYSKLDVELGSTLALLFYTSSQWSQFFCVIFTLFVYPAPEPSILDSINYMPNVQLFYSLNTFLHELKCFHTISLLSIVGLNYVNGFSSHTRSETRGNCTCCVSPFPATVFASLFRFVCF